MTKKPYLIIILSKHNIKKNTKKIFLNTAKLNELIRRQYHENYFMLYCVFYCRSNDWNNYGGKE